MQRRRWNTYCRLRTNVKQLCETIMRGNEMFKEMNYAKTNDQQWYEVVPDSCGAEDLDAVHVRVGAHQRRVLCGSCWAFGSTETLNDRRCITTDNTTWMSVEDTTDNCRFFLCFSMGCNGKQPGQTRQ